MKTERFEAPGIYVERQWDRWAGESFIAWYPHVSAGFTDRKSLLKFLAWPIKTPTGDRLREWLAGLGNPAPAENPAVDMATGFGPECHLDESDPNYQTRTVV